jgi:hypothetical protein
MKYYTYANLKNTFFRQGCNTQRVKNKDGEYLALWNGLSSWMKILGFSNGQDAYDGVFVAYELSTSPEEDDFLPNAGLFLAKEAGFEVCLDG